MFLLASLAFSVSAQDSGQTNTGESALFRGEQLLMTGSYAAATDIFQMADGLDRNEGLVGPSDGQSSPRKSLNRFNFAVG